MKKRTFIVALIICMVAIIGIGSLAYFQASKNLTNYFAVAGVSDPTDPTATIDPDDLFSIKLDETNINVMTGFGERTEEGNVYKDILPGTTLKKDPTVTNTGKYDAWVRVKVTVTDAAAWEAACEKHGITDLATIFNEYNDQLWKRDPNEDVKKDDTITYTYYYRSKVAPGGTAKLFDSVTIPKQFDIQDMVSLATFQLKITGEAIQADNTGETPQAAFELYE